MKRLILSSVLFCLTLLTYAQEEPSKQTDQGRWIADGAVFFSTNKTKSEQNNIVNETKSFGLGVSPKAAYFFIDNFAAGGELSFNYSENTFTIIGDTNESTSKNTSIAFGPFVRYYLNNGFFGEGFVGFGTGKSKSENFENTRNTFNYRLGVGYAIFIGEQLAVEPLLSYRYRRTEGDDTDPINKSSGFTLGGGFTIFL